MRIWALGLLCCSCATTVAVAPGHGAVVFDADGARVLAEGEHSVAEHAVVDDFDLRQQEVRGSFLARTSDGVPVIVADPVIGYRVIPSELGDADRHIGKDFTPLVQAITRSVIAGVLATYRWPELDSLHMRAASARIESLVAARLRPYHLQIESVDLKGLVAKLPGLSQSIADTAVWEQRSLGAPSTIALARQRADSLRAAAEGLAAANRSLAPTLTDDVLTAKRDLAWQALLRSPTTTVIHEANP